MSTLTECVERFKADRPPVRVHRAVVLSPADWRHSVDPDGTLNRAAVLRLAELGDRGIVVGIVAEIVEEAL